MEWDLYHIIYRISSNFLPYFAVSMVTTAFLGYSLYKSVRNLRFLRKIRRALTIYIREHRYDNTPWPY